MASFEETEKKFYAELNKIVTEVAFATHAEVASNTPVAETVVGDEWQPTRTGGRLKNSIVIEKDQDGSWIIGSNLKYCEYVEIGTLPHLIKPKDKKALYWVGAGTPKKLVHHPGTEGRAMFLNGAIKAERILKEILQR